MTKNDYKLSAGTLRICNYGSNFEIYFFSQNNECDFQINVYHDELVDYTCNENIEDIVEDFCDLYFEKESKKLSDEDIEEIKRVLEIYVYPHSID